MRVSGKKLYAPEKRPMQQIIKPFATILITVNRFQPRNTDVTTGSVVVWVNGPSASYTAMESDFLSGNHSGFEPGTSFVTEHDDGSDEFNVRRLQIVEADVLLEHTLSIPNVETGRLTK